MVTVRRHARIPLIIAALAVLVITHQGFSIKITLALIIAIGFVSWLSYRYLQFRAFVDAGVRNKIAQSEKSGIALSPEEVKFYRKVATKLLSPILLPWVSEKKVQSTVHSDRIRSAMAKRYTGPQPISTEPYISIVKRYKRATIHLARQSDIPEFTPASVKLGGLPHLPAGVSWPRISQNVLGTEDVPMHFVGQIDCAEILKIKGNRVPFPRMGTLLIFADLSDLCHDGKPDHCRVIYTSKQFGDSPAAELPGDLPNTFLMNQYRYEKSEKLGFTNHPQLLPETLLCGLPSVTYPEREHLHTKVRKTVGTDWEDHDDAAFELSAKAVADARATAGIDDSDRKTRITPRHQIGGYVHPIQTAYPNGNEAILLALDHDDELGCMFACGHLIFTIDEGDLQNSNFRNVKAYFYTD